MFAWNGTSTTVDRALTLIEAGALDDGSLEELAARLGIGARHLRRLFAQHLGVTPIAVAQTRRELFGKRLVTETTMNMAEIAMAAGYSSARRFNEAMRAVYRRSPSTLRRTTATPKKDCADRVVLSLAFNGDYGWSEMIAWLGARAIPGVEAITADARYVRSISIEGMAGTIEVRKPTACDGRALEAIVRIPNVSQLRNVVERIKRIFDLAADLHAIEMHLASDTLLAPLVARRRGLRVPGAWDGYELAIRAVLGQQITVSGATRLSARLVERFGDPLPEHLLDAEHDVRYLFPCPQRLAEADVAILGMPRARAAAIRAVAAEAARDPKVFAPARDLEASVSRLQALPGIGEWTAQYIAMRALREPDAFPGADIGLMRALARTDGVRPSERDVLRRAEPWRPWRAYAALHLWAHDAENAARRTA